MLNQTEDGHGEDDADVDDDLMMSLGREFVTSVSVCCVKCRSMFLLLLLLLRFSLCHGSQSNNDIWWSVTLSVCCAFVNFLSSLRPTFLEHFHFIQFVAELVTVYRQSVGVISDDNKREA